MCKVTDSWLSAAALKKFDRFHDYASKKSSEGPLWADCKLLAVYMNALVNALRVHDPLTGS